MTIRGYKKFILLSTLTLLPALSHATTAFERQIDNVLITITEEKFDQNRFVIVNAGSAYIVGNGETLVTTATHDPALIKVQIHTCLGNRTWRFIKTRYECRNWITKSL